MQKQVFFELYFAPKSTSHELRNEECKVKYARPFCYGNNHIFPSFLEKHISIITLWITNTGNIDNNIYIESARLRPANTQNYYNWRYARQFDEMNWTE